VRFRDIGIIWIVLAQVLFYATPILYPVTAFENPTYERLLMLNPIAVILEQVRVWVLNEPQAITEVNGVVQPHAPTAAEAAGGAIHLLPAVAIFIAICAFAVWIFRREAPRIAEDL
jgi:ABC-type polysaccharide/polyol phosphate export permease